MLLEFSAFQRLVEGLGRSFLVKLRAKLEALLPNKYTPTSLAVVEKLPYLVSECLRLDFFKWDFLTRNKRQL
jgi:hypothetical protein